MAQPSYVIPQAPQEKKKSMWKEDVGATKRERVIQLKALNMTCDEQIAMLKRSVDMGVIIGPRQYVTPLQVLSVVL
jgi:hypothetical protein